MMKIIKMNHSFHLVNISPWPIMVAFMNLLLVMGLLSWFHLNEIYLLLFSFYLMFLNMYQWWRDIIRESFYEGKHSLLVKNGLYWGMILFIVSEVLFFMSFFWGFFHSSLVPNIEIGLSWPPKNLIFLNCFYIPLLNSIILLSSGFTVTWAHYSILENDFYNYVQSMFITIILGIYFMFLQMFEYFNMLFCINSSVFGSIFFIATGFHGFHVIVGLIFLILCLFRGMINHFSSFHHFNFEAAVWYWHFVDVVWLFLYINIYWWMN